MKKSRGTLNRNEFNNSLLSCTPGSVFVSVDSRSTCRCLMVQLGFVLMRHSAVYVWQACIFCGFVVLNMQEIKCSALHACPWF